MREFILINQHIVYTRLLCVHCTPTCGASFYVHVYYAVVSFFAPLMHTQHTGYTESKADQFHSQNQSELWIRISGIYIVSHHCFKFQSDWFPNYMIQIRRLGYLDARDDNNIRIYLNSMQGIKRESPPPVFVKLYYRNNSTSKCLTTKQRKAFVGLTGKDNFVNYMLEITLSEVKFIPYLTISTYSGCNNESDTIQIKTVESYNPPMYNYGVCLHKAIAKDIAGGIVDWVKLNLALGAEVITLFLQEESVDLYNVLKPYVNKGLVELIEWKLEPPLTDNSSFHFGQTGVIAECVWHNMYKVRYLGLVDADEVIVPQQHNSIQDMIKAIEGEAKEARKAASFVFTNTLLKEDDTEPVLPIVERALQSKSCPGLSRESLPVYFKRTRCCLHLKRTTTKLIIRPDAVTISWVHFILAYRSKLFTKEYLVPTKVGLFYHYRPNWNHYAGCSTPLIRCKTQTIEKLFTKITQCHVK